MAHATCLVKVNLATAHTTAGLRVEKQQHLKVAAARPCAPCKLRSVVAQHGRKDGDRTGMAAAAAALAAQLTAANAAMAVDVDQVRETLAQVEALAKQTADLAGKVYITSIDLAEQVIRVTKPLVEAAAPVVIDATQAAIEAARPVATDFAEKSIRALQDSGVDVAPVVEAAKTAASVADNVTETTEKAITVVSPYAATTFDFLRTSDPSVLGIAAGALFAVYLAIPSIGRSIAFSVRGYAGDLSALQALDILEREDSFLVDVRTEGQKEEQGVPALPRGLGRKLVYVPVEEVPFDLRDQLKSPSDTEAELTAIKVASLKKINRRAKILVIDSDNEISKQVARSLASVGYRNVWVIRDGVDGRQGWAASQLAIDFYETPSASAGWFSAAAGSSSSTGTTSRSDTKRIASGSSKESTGTQKLPAAAAAAAAAATSE